MKEVIIISYIYKISNSINDKVYIGNTSYNLSKRWAEHLHDSKSDRCKHRPLYSAINEYGKENFIIELIEECSSDIAPDRERYWISFYDSYKNGYNDTFGGLGKNRINYDDVIDIYGKTHNQTETAKILNISQDSVSDILKQSNINAEPGQDVSARISSKSVEMYSLDGKYLGSFNSATQAAMYIIDENDKTNINIRGVITNIGRVCNNKRETAYQRKWKWKYPNVA